MKEHYDVISKIGTEDIEFKKLKWRNLNSQWVEPDVRDEIILYVEKMVMRTHMNKKDLIKKINIPRSVTTNE